MSLPLRPSLAGRFLPSKATFSLPARRLIHLQQPAQSESTSPEYAGSLSAPRGVFQVQGLTTTRYEDIVNKGKLTRAIGKTIRFESCTKAQFLALDPVLQGKDIFARTGQCSGRTTAYLIPLISRYIPYSIPDHGEIRIVIVTPTAERAKEVAEKAKVHALDKTGVQIHCLTGGTNPFKTHERPMIIARRSDIVVATPGRLLDHLIFNEQFKNKVANLRAIVYDTADQFIDKQAEEWLPAIQTILPKREVNSRQTLVFAKENTAHARKVSQEILQFLRYDSPFTSNQVAAMVLLPSFTSISASI